MRHLLGVLLLFLAIEPGASARIRVAFMVIRDAHGRPIALEPGGRFAHLAIRFRGKWLHAHPRRGVELTKDLSDLGEIADVVDLPGIPALASKDVSPLLGRPFDREYQWSDDSALYCSELVAKLLGIPPRPMQFSSEVWPERYREEKAGELGLSPDELYLLLTGPLVPS